MEKVSTPKQETPEVDVAILDGAVLVQMTSPGASRTFQEYADNVFMPYIMKQLQPVKRVDVIWDVYRQDSLKAATREKRGLGTRSDWKPVWTVLPQAQDICKELIHCGCKKGCTRQCKCHKANLARTALCNCGGHCQEGNQ